MNNYITINDLAKIELLVGTIQECHVVPESEKLLQLKVNFGEKGDRQILAGIKKWYQPQDLVGKQGVFVFNLKPRTMLGLESQGMMLCAQDSTGLFQLVTVTAPVPDGTQLG
ncbi:MAG TPA: methionine--tRNA ligase [Candidatus Dependentiae bacterium]|nr:methionine--tRNA ligase [Candidatus Dependentiae bacterium]